MAGELDPRAAGARRLGCPGVWPRSQPNLWDHHARRSQPFVVHGDCFHVPVSSGARMATRDYGVTSN